MHTKVRRRRPSVRALIDELLLLPSRSQSKQIRMTNGFLKKLRNSELLLEGFSRWKESEIVDSNVRSTFRSRQATKSPHVSALVGAHSNTNPFY